MTSEDQGPPAVIRVGGGKSEGEGEGIVLARRHGVREVGHGRSRALV